MMGAMFSLNVIAFVCGGAMGVAVATARAIPQARIIEIVRMLRIVDVLGILVKQPKKLCRNRLIFSKAHWIS